MNARIIRIVATEDGRPQAVVVGFAALLALLSVSCCILPIGLSIIGLGGVWLAVLGPFVASLCFVVAASSPVWEEAATRVMMGVWSATR